MVIQVDNEGPLEISFLKPIEVESSHIFPRNDVLELNKTDNKLLASLEVSDTVSKKMVKSKRKSKKITNSCSSSTDNEENVPSITEISAEDLQELKTVYKQCQVVMKKIELKYGHLMSLDTSNPSVSIDTSDGPRRKRRRMTGDDKPEEETVCQCTLNKKIVFDEDGNEVLIDASVSNHVCPKKLISLGNQNTVTHIESKNIQIEYNSNEVVLTEDLEELRCILRNPEIETTYRNQVINKLKSVKQEHANELKFNKHSIIEKVKSNPDEVFQFIGANLSILQGYCI